MPDDLPDLPEIPDEIHITDPSQFEALTSGLRMRVLKLCEEPSSVREIAARLEMPVTRLYYHVNLLEDAGFLEVVHTRKSGARLEKVYRIAGRTITPGPEMLETIDDPDGAARAVTATVIEPARAETEDALRRRFRGDDQPMYLGRSHAVLSPAQVEAFRERHRALVEEFMAEDSAADDPDSCAYAFTYALVPSEPG